MSRSASDNSSCQHRPELLSPYNAFQMTRVAEFRAGDNVCLFLSVRLKTGITNICSPDFKVIEFSYKSEESNTMEGDNT